jgi:integrase
MALKAGVPVKVISERFGHADVAFTMNVYAHAIPGMFDCQHSRYLRNRAGSTWSPAAYDPHESSSSRTHVHG